MLGVFSRAHVLQLFFVGYCFFCTSQSMGVFRFKLCRLVVFSVIPFEACIYFTRMQDYWKRLQVACVRMGRRVQVCSTWLLFRELFYELIDTLACNHHQAFMVWSIITSPGIAYHNPTYHHIVSHKLETQSPTWPNINQPFHAYHVVTLPTLSHNSQTWVGVIRHKPTYTHGHNFKFPQS